MQLLNLKDKAADQGDPKSGHILKHFTQTECKMNIGLWMRMSTL